MHLTLSFLAAKARRERWSTSWFTISLRKHTPFLQGKHWETCTGFEFLPCLKGSEVKWSESHSVASDPLRPHGLHNPWNSLGQNTGVGRLSLLHRIFPTQGLHPGLPYLPSEPQGKLKNSGLGTYPFSSRSSWPRNWTGVSCIAGRFFTNWAIREALKGPKCGEEALPWWSVSIGAFSRPHAGTAWCWSALDRQLLWLKLLTSKLQRMSPCL